MRIQSLPSCQMIWIQSKKSFIDNSITILFCLFVGGITIVGGIHGYTVDPTLWGNYVLMGIGGWIVGVAAISFLWEACGFTDKILGLFVEHEKSKQNLEQRKQLASLITQSKPLFDHLSKPQASEKLPLRPISPAFFPDSKEIASYSIDQGRIGDLPIELVTNILQSLKKPKELGMAASVCKLWYCLINQENSTSRKTLDIFFDHGLPLKGSMSDTLVSLFPNPSSIPMIADFKLDLSYMGNTGYLENLTNLIPVFENEKQSILRTQDCHARWVFLIRVRKIKRTKVKDAVIAIFQRATGRKDLWVIQTGIECKKRYNAIKYLDCQIGKEHFAWIAKLLNNEPNLGTEFDKGLYQLWTPS